MSAHRAVIEAGPGVIRRLCCGTGMVTDTEMMTAALAAIDDAVALVDERPVAVDSLWRTVLASLDCGPQGSVVVVHPSWWAVSRVAVVTAAAGVLAADVVPRPRSWLLARASADRPVTVVEVADRLVVVTGTEVAAEPRRGQPRRVVERVARVVAELTPATAAVLIDGPNAIAGAPELAMSIATAVRRGGLTVVPVDDAMVARLAAAAFSAEDEAPAAAVGAARPRRRLLFAAAGVALAAAVPAVGTFGGRGAPPAQGMPTTYLVEGHIAVLVPANWPTRRVVAGPGSARVQVTSPADPEAALHITQSPVVGETLSGTAESLKRAIDAEPAGVFVDFNPSGLSAGRPAVSYREVRAGHDIRWTVLLDGAVRISLGCQSRPGGEDAVRDACEQAMRSARALR